jgi:hypothetical protein
MVSRVAMEATLAAAHTAQPAAAVIASRVAMEAILAAAHRAQPAAAVMVSRAAMEAILTATHIATEGVLVTSCNKHQPPMLSSISSTKCTAWQEDAFLRVKSGDT